MFERWSILAVALCSLVGLVSASAGEYDRQLTVRPASLPTPSLKYRLLPAPEDLQSGNAAILYYRPFALLSESHKSTHDIFPYDFVKGSDGEEHSRVSDWLALPLKEFPHKEISEYLGRFRSMLREIDAAALRKTCAWEQEDRRDGLILLLPEVQILRAYADRLALRCRVELAEGNVDQALRTVQSGLALARNLSQGPSLIHAIVGNAIARIMFDRLEEIMQAPQAPNLYWALTVLPSPFIDLRPALAAEATVIERLFPQLKDMEKAPVTDEFIAAFRNELEEWKTKKMGLKGGFPHEIMTQAMLAEAKANLVKQGWKTETVDKMPQFQVVVVDAMRRHRNALAEMTKWYHVAYAQGRTNAEAARKGFQEAAARLDLLMFDSILERLGYYDGFGKTWTATTKLDRRIAMLRCIEAVRLHAAEFEEWPRAIKDIRAVPIPLDPLTGQSFDYQVAGDKATLIARSPDGETAASATLKYELTLRK